MPLILSSSSNATGVRLGPKNSTEYHRHATPCLFRMPPDVPAGTREILERYSKVPSAEVISHCEKIRDRAYAVFPYPCVGTYRFLELSVSRLPIYDEIVDRLTTKTQSFLDLGTCIGQDIRRLVYDGVPSENTYGVDLQHEFMQIGYDLFLDKDTLRTTFVAADVFEADSDLTRFDGKIDILQASAFFHLFSRDQQKQVARRVIKLLKPQSDSLLVGRQVGTLEPGEYPTRTDPNRKTYRHNRETWDKFWNEMGAETGTKWATSSILEHVERPKGISDEEFRQWAPLSIWLVFSVRRLE